MSAKSVKEIAEGDLSTCIEQRCMGTEKVENLFWDTCLLWPSPKYISSTRTDRLCLVPTYILYCGEKDL